MRSNLLNEEKVKLEAKQQNEYLNSIIGVFSFTLALTCMALPNTQMAALFCLGIIIPLLFSVPKYFPPTIAAVRDLAEETKDPEIIELKRYLEKNYSGFRAIISKNFVYLYGLLFFVLTLRVPGFTTWMTGC